MTNICKIMCVLGLMLAGPAGCIATYETPPPPRDSYVYWGGRGASMRPYHHHRPRPMFDRRPTEHPAAKHPVRPAPVASAGANRGKPPTVR